MKKSVEQLLMKIYAGRADIHLDLYQLSNQHRRKHGRTCDMYPSDPLQAPLWTVIASLTHARRILEIGCGHGYTTAVMASAAGPDCHVDTIEENPQHAALAEKAFQERNLSGRIAVIRGRGQ
ncbi:MAG TPA: methyltransferase, partial [Candidatus Bathyarchaeia archaeon]